LSRAKVTEAGLKMAPARCLHDAALAGAINMARDEALLECRTAATLRFYRWAKPTLSYGYFQAAESLAWRDFIARGYEVVRRSTGGKAILHEQELTYSLCLPESGVLAGGPAHAMQAIHTALASCMEPSSGGAIALRAEQGLLSDRPGSAWCFEDSSPLDLVTGGRKLVGSAARRRHGWVLFHGSIVVAAPAETPHIAELGAEPQLDRLRRSLGAALGFDFLDGNWTAEELVAADVAKIRHCSAAWILRA